MSFSIPSYLSDHYADRWAELSDYDQQIDHRLRTSVSSTILNSPHAPIEFIIGIPFYEETSNIMSVLVTLRQVCLQFPVRSMIAVVGEFVRSDLVQAINVDIVESDNGDENEQEQIKGGSDESSGNRPKGKMPPKTKIVTLWKPHPKYAGKPFTVRCLQRLAAMANNGKGAHLVVVDADIQFNHWELSAKSLLNALLLPLFAYDVHIEKQAEEKKSNDSNNASLVTNSSAAISMLSGWTRSLAPKPSSFVCLNAPRSFLSDDAFIHLLSFFYHHATLGLGVHQSHGGEWSVHKKLNQLLLNDRTVVYRDCYEVEAQAAYRSSGVWPIIPSKQITPPPSSPTVSSTKPTNDPTSPAPSSPSAASVHPSSTVSDDPTGGVGATEVLLKGKWHAKITLAKLLQINSEGRARIDLVTERLFDETLLISSQGLYKAPNRLILQTGGLTKDPDPRRQQLLVLAPVAARIECYNNVLLYYHQLLNSHLTAGKQDIPIDSRFVKELLPLMHARLTSTDKSQRNAYRLIVSSLPRPPAEAAAAAKAAGVDELPSDAYFVFDAKTWASYTVEILLLYKNSTTPANRKALVIAHRILWLLGTISFLNDHASGDWGTMHTMMNKYAVVFRKEFLEKLFGVDPNQVHDELDDYVWSG